MTDLAGKIAFFVTNRGTIFYGIVLRYEDGQKYPWKIQRVPAQRPDQFVPFGECDIVSRDGNSITVDVIRL